MKAQCVCYLELPRAIKGQLAVIIKHAKDRTDPRGSKSIL